MRFRRLGLWAIILLACLPAWGRCVNCERDAQGRIKRSAAAVRQFKRSSECPTGDHFMGRCPGYVVDHIIPLQCGGLDAPENMAWMSVEDGKVKDAWEGDCKLYGGKHKGLRLVDAIALHEAHKEK